MPKVEPLNSQSVIEINIDDLELHVSDRVNLKHTFPGGLKVPYGGTIHVLDRDMPLYFGNAKLFERIIRLSRLTCNLVVEKTDITVKMLKGNYDIETKRSFSTINFRNGKDVSEGFSKERLYSYLDPKLLEKHVSGDYVPKYKHKTYNDNRQYRIRVYEPHRLSVRIYPIQIENPPPIMNY